MTERLLFFGAIAVLLTVAAAVSSNPMFSASAVAMWSVLVLLPMIIPLLHKLKFGQSIRGEGPQSHLAKSGTPTMGGVAIIAAAVFGTVSCSTLSPEILLALFITVGHFVLGFIDDYIKVVKKRNLGLKAKQKLLGQIFIAVITMYFALDLPGIDTSLYVPFTNETINIGILYCPLVLFVLVGASNAVNLTDGLDGLAASTVAVAMICYAVISVSFGSPNLAVFCCATAAACIGFLAFNEHPAKVFMGDTGSLALGGAFAAAGILTHTELLLVVIGLIFVAEALSVIIQVISFQTTGKRVFRMSPLHHHFELGGWSEEKVVAVFRCVGILVGVLGAVSYCWR